MQTDDALFPLGNMSTKVLYLIRKTVGRGDLHSSREVLPSTPGDTTTSQPSRHFTIKVMEQASKTPGYAQR